MSTEAIQTGIEVVQTGELVERTNFGIIGGSFFVPETMEPMAAFFRMGGRGAEVIRDLPTDDSDATPEDHARALADQIRQLGENVILLAWSGGSGHVGEALRILEEEDGSHPVRLVVSISGSLGELPPRDGDEAAAPMQPRNSQQFRDGIIHPDDKNHNYVDYDRNMAPDVFFNLAPEIGALLVKQMMQPQFRVAASPMPRKLNTPWLYLHPQFDNVRNLASVLEAREYYKDDPYKMDVRILPDQDHSVPISDPFAIWTEVINYCLRHEIQIVPPPNRDSMAQGFAPLQRRTPAPLPAQTAAAAVPDASFRPWASQSPPPNRLPHPAQRLSEW